MNSNEFPKSDYQLFREKKHEQFSTPQEIINTAVEKASGSKILSQERVVAGETNEVHFVKTENGQELVIRIYHGDKPKFERERWAIEQCARSGVPVPKVLLVEKFEVESKPIEICIENRLEGRGLGDVGGTDFETANFKEMLGKLGATLEKIHSVPTEGFGSLDKNGHGKYTSAKDLILNDQFISRERILPTDGSIPFDREIVRKAKETLQSEAEHLPEIKPRLLHGDLAPQHVLTANNEISGIIDFEYAKGSDPAEEFARWEIKFGDKFPISDIQVGFVNQEIFAGDFEKRKNIWRLYQGLVILSYCLRERKAFAITKIVQGLEDTLSRLSQF